MSRSSMGMNLTLTPGVKWLLIVTISFWFLVQVLIEQYVFPSLGAFSPSRFLSLQPVKVIFEFQVWQIVSYIFLHTLQISHILFNMLMLFFLGIELEQRWGTKKFVLYYLISGAGAAVIYCLGTLIYFAIKPATTAMSVPVMGASGSIFGLLIAFGILFGERTIYAFGVVPIKAKFFVLIMGFIEFASLMTADVNGGDVAYLAHLGGLISGYLALLYMAKSQQKTSGAKSKKRNANLKLVVDNEKENRPQNDGGSGPKYWN